MLLHASGMQHTSCRDLLLMLRVPLDLEAAMIFCSPFPSCAATVSSTPPKLPKPLLPRSCWRLLLFMACSSVIYKFNDGCAVDYKALRTERKLTASSDHSVGQQQQLMSDAASNLLTLMAQCRVLWTFCSPCRTCNCQAVTLVLNPATAVMLGNLHS